MTPAFRDPIYVTRPLLPPLDAVHRLLGDVWDAQWLTNAGAKHQALEEALRRHLGVDQLSLFNNGTIGLMTTLRALELSGEVITTPFTFPATPHALSLTGLTPVFCDIDPVRMTLDPAAVELAITPETSAILAVHVYGIPCDVAGLQSVADRHGLRVVYDAAHAFGASVDGRGIGTFGNASMFSFHATKLFHTAEGGAVACADPALRARIDRLKNFGIVDQEHVDVVGLNGKMNELQAVMGLAVLECLAAEIASRRAVSDVYRRRLDGVPGLTLAPCVPGAASVQYFVVRINAREFGRSRDQVHEALKAHNVFTRKYFYPLCTDYGCYHDLPSSRRPMPAARAAVSEVLCLPIYGTLPLADVETICDLLVGEGTR
jgi:dTDP-4-amino-4,6-dideoxygalactose transaminase